MDELEKIIMDNKDKFNNGELPKGHRDRFLQKIAGYSNHTDSTSLTRDNLSVLKKRSHSFAKIALSIAAIAVIIFTIALLFNNNRGNNDTLYTINTVLEEDGMYELQEQILKLVEGMDEADKTATINNINSITFEAIPMSEQLPDEMSNEEKAKILKKYYKQKTEGLKKIKIFIAEQNMTIDE